MLKAAWPATVRDAPLPASLLFTGLVVGAAACIPTELTIDPGGAGGAGGAGVDPVWGCLGHLTEPDPDPTRTVELTVRFVFASGGAALTGGIVDICDKLDITCGGSEPEHPKGIALGGDGLVTVSVEEGFDGFIRVTDPEIVDSRFYVGAPIVTAPKVKEIQLLRPNEYAALAGIAQGIVDETRGTAIFLAVDCKGAAAGGVRFETPNADDESIAFYLINQGPVLPPTATATDADGFGGFFNLPVAAAVGRSFRAEDDVYIGESSFQVVANTISYVQLAPTP